MIDKLSYIALPDGSGGVALLIDRESDTIWYRYRSAGSLNFTQCDVDLDKANQIGVYDLPSFARLMRILTDSSKVVE